ncbi:MAG: 2-succinyl-6-hydroxy-2,4-cyclohexadiene-1-carboxylate synthase [Chlorobiaceae bacterium]|nr:2-succinyl-6-hydroxy-2,4-cyclohexadiene-1-carboxylate synthase [Chlorobiaceae bacterium]
MSTTSSGHTHRVLTLGDPANPGILFLHGFLGSGRDWLPVAQRLADRFHCLLPDMPGHGDNRQCIKTGATSFHHAALELLCSVEPLHSGPLHLVGYSMGGRMGLYLTLRFSEWFVSSTIVSASPGLRTGEERRQRQSSDDALAKDLERDFGAFLDRWYNLPLFATLKADPSFGEVLAARRSGDPKALAACLRALGTGNQPQLWDELSGNRVPILFCAGEKDAKFVEIGRQMVNLCPVSALEIFPGGGHTLHVEERARFIERLTVFINNHRLS